jgi:hypothetical protein
MDGTLDFANFNWGRILNSNTTTLESVIDVGQGICVGPGRFGKKNKRRAWKIWKKE